ncbi:MAG: STN domain-containing protein [Gemmataceae bacterium]|nr:STN domain-containing protein [Gemmataceae bacterium]
MSTTRSAGLLCAVIAGSMLIPAALAQAPKNDLLDKKVLENKVAAQKIEAEVSDAVADARKLASAQPGQAVDVLKRALNRLEADTALTQDRRDALVKMLKSRISLYGNDSSKTPDNRTAKMQLTKAEEEAKAAEDRVVQRTIELINQLKKDRRYAEAARAAEDLQRRYPTNAAVRAVVAGTTRSDTLAGGQDIRNESNYRFNGAMVSVDRSKLPPVGDLEFPKDWREKMKYRKGLNEPVLTAKEMAIVKSLSKPINTDYDKAAFTDVIEDLATKLDCTIVVDKAALNDALVNSETQISLKIKGVSARTVLRKVLADLGLAYVVKNEVIQVVSMEKAKEMMVQRTYYLGDLLAGGSFTDAGIRFVPGIDQFQAMQNVVNIIGLIQSTVDPDSWEANGKGGKGTIAFYGPGMGIVIKNTAEVHGMMSGILK